MAYLSQLNIYPIKSLAGISVDRTEVGELGLAFDRRLMLVNAKGQFLTARKCPQLLSYTTRLVTGGVEVKASQESSMTVEYSDFKQDIQVTLWREELLLKSASEPVNQWFSTLLGQDVRLVMLTENCIRFREKLEQQVNLSDGYPLLLIGESSLAELNRRASESSSMEQFRTNLVIAGADAFAEDCWHKIKIGEVIFELVKPCERCVMTTVDLSNFTPRSSREPLATLARFRADHKGRLMFGENLIAKNTGVIKVGDPIEVISTRTSAQYGAK